MAMLEDAASWLAATLNESLAVMVSWRPRGGSARELPAVMGRTVFRSSDGYGMTTHAESRDFIVRTEDMPEEPGTGDCFVWKGIIYEVLAPSGEPVWRWSDGYMNARRVHTKETGREEEYGRAEH